MRGTLIKKIRGTNSIQFLNIYKKETYLYNETTDFIANCMCKTLERDRRKKRVEGKGQGAGGGDDVLYTGN